MPNPAAKISIHGLDGCSVSANPMLRSSTIPKTRWCTCRPPSILTLPGHQDTFGLRIRRALVRMNRNESRKKASRISPARAEASSRKLSPSNSRISSATGMDRPYTGQSGRATQDSHAIHNGADVNRLSNRTRGIAGAALVVVGAVLLFAGTIAFYAREQLIDQDAFADRAVEALEDDGVRHLVSREIVVNLIDRGSTDLVAARPLLESVVDTVVGTQPFRRVFRAAARETNRVFFVRERGNALFDLGDASQIVQFALRSVSPRLAKEIPKDLEPQLLTLRRRDFAGTTLGIADDVRVLGILLPLLALAALAAGVAVSPDRRVGLLRAGVAVGATGALLAVTLLTLRARTLAGVIGEDEVTDEEVRDAVAGLLDVYLGDLVLWGLLLALLGLLVGAAAAALEPDAAELPTARLRRRLLERPPTRG